MQISAAVIPIYFPGNFSNTVNRAAIARILHLEHLVVVGPRRIGDDAFIYHYDPLQNRVRRVHKRSQKESGLDFQSIASMLPTFV